MDKRAKQIYKGLIRQKDMLSERSMLDAITSIYNSIHLLDFEKDVYNEIQATPEIHDYVGSTGKISECFPAVMKEMTTPESRESMVSFVEFETITEKLRECDNLEVDFRGVIHGWIRASFFVISRTLTGKLRKVLFTTRVVDVGMSSQMDFEKDMPVAYVVLRAIYDESHTQVRDMEFVFVNQKYCEWTGKAPEELIGQTIYGTFERTNDDWLKNCQEVMIEGKSSYGRVFAPEMGAWVSFNCAPVSKKDCCAFAFINSDEEQKQFETNEAVIYCTTVLNSERDYKTAMNKMFHTLGYTLHADYIFLMEVNNNMLETTFKWTCRSGEDLECPPKYPMHVLLRMREFMNTHRSVSLYEVDDFKQFDNSVYENMKARGVKNLAIKILYSNRRPIGIICVENYEDDHVLDIQQVLNKISYYVSFRITNHDLVDELDTVGNRDALTGLLNRHGIDRYTDQYIYAHEMMPCTLIMLDIDNFKYVNDMFGHLSGDEVLCTLANNLKKIFPEEALIARNGGDEFLVFMKNTTAQQAEPYIDRLVHMDMEFQFEEGRCMVTVSAGYVEYPKQANGLQDLFKKADIALYAVKLNGKNGAHIYEEGMEKEDRKQLGFNMNDIVENIPCALIVHEAKEGGHILFANNQALDMFDCTDLNEFLQFAGLNCRGFIHEEDYDWLMEDLSLQNAAGLPILRSKRDYRVVTRKGTVKRVFDMQRLVESKYHGSIVYVLIFMKESCEELS